MPTEAGERLAHARARIREAGKLEKAARRVHEGHRLELIRAVRAGAVAGLTLRELGELAGTHHGTIGRWLNNDDGEV